MEKAWRPSDETIATRVAEPVALPDLDSIPVEETAFIDTFSRQFDRHYQLTEGIESWLNVNPDYDCFTYLPETTDGTYTPDQGAFKVTMETSHIVKKYVGLNRYEYLRNHSELGYAVAQDVVESWRKPSEE